MSDLTESQKRAVKWLANRGGTGVFNRHRVLLAQGELAGVMAATWASIASRGLCTIERNRVTLSEHALALSKSFDLESYTVPDRDD